MTLIAPFKTGRECEEYTQANLIIVPSKYAKDFRRLCQRNPVSCPLLAESPAPGDPTFPDVAKDCDIRKDAPGYNIYVNGKATQIDVPNIDSFWTEDSVAFLSMVGCSFSFEGTLAAAGLAPRHMELGINVPMYRTSVALMPSGVFGGNMVVSMRPYQPEDVEKVRDLTRPFGRTHGEPVAWGWSAVKALGLTDIHVADFGDAPVFREGEVPVFWACGVTPQLSVMGSPDVKGMVIGHAPVSLYALQTLNRHLEKVWSASSIALGGKSPHIVFADADLGKAVESVAMGIFFNHGQNCCAGSRAFVQGAIYDRFIAALGARIKKIKVSKIQYDRITSLVESGLSTARLVTEGKQDSLGGFFIEPTLFADLHEEIFGPVLCIHRFDSVEEVIARAKDTGFGLASGLHTTNITTAIHVANALEAGVVWVNQYGALPAQLSMGGYKQSGIGRDLGSYALAEYTQVKTVQIGLSIPH